MNNWCHIKYLYEESLLENMCFLNIIFSYFKSYNCRKQIFIIGQQLLIQIGLFLLELFYSLRGFSQQR